ncbi:hypothetical protein D3C76_1774770 [compost metagenome]
MERINNVMNRIKLVRYNNGINMPKGIKAAMFPKPTRSITVGCRISDRPGSLKKSSGKKIKVYSVLNSTVPALPKARNIK